MTFDASTVAARITAGIELLDPGYPRDLASLAPLVLPMSVSVVAGLTTEHVEISLSAMIGRAPHHRARRRLRGCLVAHRGNGAMFLDEDDEALQRFAAAHELAHFAGHYLERREVAVARLGVGVLEVLDGEREPTASEMLGGILSGSPLGVFTDVMDRDGGVPLSRGAEMMEYEADEAAFLALAPIGVVISKTIDASGRVDAAVVVDVLVRQFGLARADAERHAPRVLGAWARSRPTLVDRLRMAASGSGERRHI